MYQLKKSVYYATSYYRLSNDDGDLLTAGKAESNSISNQRSLIQDFVKDKPDIILCKERIDDGFSGVDFERPAFKKMIEDIKNGKTDCIIVKDLSRFGRNYIEVGRYLEKIFPYLGVRFIAVNDHYDSVTANSTQTHLMVPFKNLLNDSYSRDISAKVRSQFELKRKNGDFIGSFAVYGYKKDENNKNHLMIDDYAASIVSDIFKWKLDGKSNDIIADQLNAMGVLSPAEYKKSLGLKYDTGFMSGKQALWSPVAVSRILRDQTYMGYVVQGKKTTLNYKVKKVIEKKPQEWVVVKEKHQPIISEEEFQLVQKVLAMDTRRSTKKQEVYLFSGLVICNDCGQSMVRKVVSAGKDKNGKVRKYPYFICSTYKKDKTQCKSHMIREHIVEQTLTIIVKNYMDLLGNLSQPFHSKGGRFDVQLQKVTGEISKLKSLKISLYEDLADGVIDKNEFFELKEYISERISQSKQQIIELNREQEQGKCKDITLLNRRILLKLIDQIEVFESNRIKITFRKVMR